MLVCLLALALASEVDTAHATRDGTLIVFAPQAGTVLRKTFHRVLELEADAVGTSPAKWRDEYSVVLVDEYGSVGEGRTLNLHRTYERMRICHQQSWEFEVFGRPVSGEVHREGRGAIEGECFAFDWCSTDERYVLRSEGDCGPDDGSGDRLDAEADLRGILPWESVAVGDAWFTDADLFVELLWPGGVATLLDESDRALPQPVDEHIRDDLDGTFRVELETIERTGGARYAGLRLHGILEARTSFEHEWAAPLIDAEFGALSRQELEIYASVRGHLYWNLDAQHVDSIRIEADVEIDQNATFTPADAYRRFFESFGILDDFPFQREWTGTFTAEARVERTGRFGGH